MSKGRRLRAEREARQLAHDYTQFTEGQWVGTVGKVGDADGGYPVAHELIRRYNERSRDLRACPHLHADPDQARFWVDAVPELVACLDCTAALAEEEAKRANTCCVLCGAQVEVRSITVSAGGVVLRGGVCADCEDEAGVTQTLSAR